MLLGDCMPAEGYQDARGILYAYGCSALSQIYEDQVKTACSQVLRRAAA